MKEIKNIQKWKKMYVMLKIDKERNLKQQRQRSNGQGLENTHLYFKMKKGWVKDCPNFQTTLIILKPSKIILKILQFGFQQYKEPELPDAQSGFRRGRGTKNDFANIWTIVEKTGI